MSIKVTTMLGCNPTVQSSSTSENQDSSSSSGDTNLSKADETTNPSSTSENTTQSTDSSTSENVETSGSSSTGMSQVTTGVNEESSTSVETSVETTVSVPECGNGIIEMDEVCDDGVNGGGYNSCTADCSAKGPFCGDGIIQKIYSEECDDGNDNNNDDCTSLCLNATCGDGYLWQGKEECDDKNSQNNDSCTNECKNAFCGDGFVYAGIEKCDDGINNDSYNSCAPDCKNKAPTYCGDGKLQKEEGEHCDGLAGLNGWTDVSCQSNCLFDFSKIEQLYCLGTCSWAGPANCDQEDADILCKLKTGNSSGKAQLYSTQDSPLEISGFGCSHVDGISTNLGPMPQFGLNKDVYFYSGNMHNVYMGNTITKVSCGEK